MKKIFFVWILIVITSCGEDISISDELIGEWIYERETFNNSEPFEDLDTKGYLSFRNGYTGNWNQSNLFINFNLEWRLQSDDTEIKITREFIGAIQGQSKERIYKVDRVDEDNYVLSYHLKVPDPNATIEGFEEFENILLIRLK